MIGTKINIGDKVTDTNDPDFSGKVIKIWQGSVLAKSSSFGSTARQLCIADCILENQKMTTLLIDWSVIAYEAWHRMSRKDYISETSSEIVEFTRNIAEETHYLVQRFAPAPEDQIYFLLDSKNWRVPFYQSYYNKFLKAWRIQDKETKELGYLFTHDTYTYLIWDKQEPKNPKKGFKLPELKLSKKAFDALKPRVRKKPVDEPYKCERIRQFLPTYKGNRPKQKWDYHTPKREFQDVLRPQSAYSLARTFGARVAKVGHCEADDLVYAAALLHASNDIVCVSSDSDLDQIRSDVLFFRRWSPENDKRHFFEPTAEEAAFDEMCKILSGDSSDNIKPVTMGTTTIGDKKAKTLLKDLGEKYSHFGEGPWAAHPSFKRNLKLVSLACAPEKLLKAARKGVQQAKVPEGKPLKMEGYGVSKATLISNKRKAAKHREEQP